MSLDSKKELLKKLAALSKRGIGGEATNAEDLLNKLLKKYNLTLEDITNDSSNKTPREFIYEDSFQKRLLDQMLYAYFPQRKTYFYTNQRLKKNRQITIIELTDEEYIEFAYAYDIYKESLKEELDMLYHAFICQNKLFPKENSENEDVTDISDIYNAEDLMKLEVFKSGIREINLKKAIGTGGSQ